LESGLNFPWSHWSCFSVSETSDQGKRKGDRGGGGLGSSHTSKCALLIWNLNDVGDEGS
jgi:hypothetical protein